MPTWIDFKELRAKLKFEDVLTHFGVEIRRKGEQHMGFCPLPKHNGNRNSQSFSANLERGIFHCFGCGAKGNVLDFAVLMSGEHPDDGRAVKKVAADLRAKFFPEDAVRNGRKTEESKPTEKPAQLEIEELANTPLDFELKNLDPSHPYLSSRGFTKETVEYFGLGYCSRGSLEGRIAIPLHDAEGKLIGYAGRVVDDALITADNPRYRLPTKRERDGRVLEFRKTLFVYNGSRLKPEKNLVVVEGFPSVWWLHQNGFTRVVGTMGSECSEKQIELILSLVYPRGSVLVIPDGDKAGEKFAHSLIPLLSANRFVRWLKLPPDCQPTDLTKEKLEGYVVF